MKLKRKLAVVVWLALGAGGAAAQERDWSKVEIKTEQLAPGIWMLEGAGGNIGVSAGEDGVFLIDDQYAPLTAKIKAAVAAVSPKPIRFVLNTHWHGDHTGGNENLGKGGVLIVAHDNVRRRLSAEQFSTLWQRTTPPSPPGALPVVTFSDTVTFHLNGEEVHAFHLAPAHTDGDAAVHFRRADVLHTGDVFFNGRYPYIDVDAGGSLKGVIAAADRLLALAGPRTRIIPGHGPRAGVAELRAYREMLAAALARVEPLVRAGKSVEEIVALRPMAEFDEKWGQDFMKPDIFLRLLHLSLSRDLTPAR